MRFIGDRSRARLLDKLIKDKRHGWRSLVIAGVKDDLEAKSLVQWCRNLALTVVWRVVPESNRSERQRQEFARDRMRKWAAIYPRFTLVESSTADAARALAGQQYDAVALWGLSPAQLAAEGPAWAALVRDGGALLGMDHRVIDCRRVLNAAVPKWRTHRDGVWMVDVKRAAVHDDLVPAGLGVGVVDESGGVEGAPRGTINVSAEVGIEGVLPDGQLLGGHPVDSVVVAHDPVHSGPDVDDAVHVAAPVAGAEGESSAVAESYSISAGAEAEPVPHVGVDAPLRGLGDLSEADVALGKGRRRGKRRGYPGDSLGHSGGGAFGVTDEPLPTLAVGGSELHGANVAPPAPKRRGRPPGSKNKAPGVTPARGRRATA